MFFMMRCRRFSIFSYDYKRCILFFDIFILDTATPLVLAASILFSLVEGKARLGLMSCSCTTSHTYLLPWWFMIHHKLSCFLDFKNQKPPGYLFYISLAVVSSGAWIRTKDLRVMSPTSCHCSSPHRVEYSNTP